MTSYEEQQLGALRDFFRQNEPQVVLISYADNHQAKLQLLDCDDYRIGTLVCEEVVALCISTRWQSFDRLSVYKKGGVPEAFAWLGDLFVEGDLLIVMQPIDGEGSVLPMIAGQRLAYIVCKSAHYEKEQSPGR